MIQILGLLGMYFDAVVVFVTNSSLLFRLAVAILCYETKMQTRFFTFIPKSPKILEGLRLTVKSSEHLFLVKGCLILEGAFTFVKNVRNR